MEMLRLLLDQIKMYPKIVALVIYLALLGSLLAFSYFIHQQEPISALEIEMQPSKTIFIYDHQSLSGYISSPHYPNPFPLNMTASVNITSSNGKITTAIRLTFLDFDLQTSNLCGGEGLTIYAPESHFRMTLCAGITPEPVIVRANNSLINLLSDEFGSGLNRGFRIKYEFIDLNKTNGCPGPDMFMCRNRRCIPNSLICNRNDDCGDASDEDSRTPCKKTPTILYNSNYKCGLSKSSATSKENNIASKINQSNILRNRIIGGRKAMSTEIWSSLASIQKENLQPISIICGGTLIHPMFVIASAHCFEEDTNYRIIFGLKDLRSSINHSSTVQIRYARLISFYPGLLHPTTLGSKDLALIELNAPIKMTPDVWPACLPHLSEPIVANRQCLTAGFGETRGTGFPFSLKEVEQVVVHNSDCVSSYRSFKFDDYHMICVLGGNQSGPCHGDSGGPLMCLDGSVEQPTDRKETRLSWSNIESGGVIQNIRISDESYQDSYHTKEKNQLVLGKLNGPSRLTVHGLAGSTTDGNLGGGYCGLKGVPIIYTRVSTKVEWILSVMDLSKIRLSDQDRKQDGDDWSNLFGYMFRTGSSRHQNFTRTMTIKQNQTTF